MQSGWLEHFMARKGPDAAPDTDEVSRREFIHGGLVAGAAAGFAAGSTLPSPQLAQAQSSSSAGDTPIGPKWWPSRWGAQDEAGASNWITPAKVLEATKHPIAIA